MRPYSVGITIWVSASGDLGLFENGLRQNVVFLYQLFKSAPACRRVVLLNHGESDRPIIPSDVPLRTEDIVRGSEVQERLDFVIVMGAALDAESAARYRNDGTKLICYKGGNGIVISMEAIIAQPPRHDAERYFDRNFYDAIWMTPQHLRTYRSYCEVLYRCPVYAIQQVWSPLFLDSRRAGLSIPFGYQPGRPKKRVGILDPNITVMKTSHMPALVCEAAYRVQPGLFEAIYVTNALQYLNHPHFNSFAGRLQSFKDRVATVEPRFVTADFLAHHADAVVTHHWENGLNYLYYDVLYGGYPLIHNSEFLRGYGYYYDDFDAESGGRVLIEALQRHDAELGSYRARNESLFASLDPTAPQTIAAHEALLETLA
jgi:hypothetical protein